MNIYERIFESSPDALLVVDQTGHIVLANERAESLFAFKRSELIGRPIEVLIPPRFADHHVNLRSRFTKETHGRQMGTAVELYGQRKDGSEFPADIMLSPISVDGERVTLCIVRDITEHKAAQEEIERQTTELRKLHADLQLLAYHDGLTGLYNWRAFYEHAAQQLKTAHRRQENVTLFMLDLDLFKLINDRFGHPEGDRVLQAVAATLKAAAREVDIVARHGGEEFVVLALGLTEAGSLVAAERMRAAISGIENLKSRITTSIGVATLSPQQQQETTRELTALLDQADQALYAAKHNGRDQVCHYNRISGLLQPPIQSLP